MRLFSLLTSGVLNRRPAVRDRDRSQMCSCDRYLRTTMAAEAGYSLVPSMAIYFIKLSIFLQVELRWD